MQPFEIHKHLVAVPKMSFLAVEMRPDSYSKRLMVTMQYLTSTPLISTIVFEVIQTRILIL